MSDFDTDDVLDISMDDDFSDLESINSEDAIKASLKALNEQSPIKSKPEPKPQTELPKISTEDLLGMEIDDEDDEAEDDLDDLKALEREVHASNFDSSENSVESVDEDDEDNEEDWDFSVLKTKMKGLTVPIVVALIIIIGLVILMSKKTTETPTIDSTSVTPNTLNTGLFSVESDIVVEEKNVQDFIVAYKYMFTWNDLAQPVIKGETTKQKKVIEIPVDIELFNTLEDGQIITVHYDLVSFNHNEYATNITLGEVVGE